MSARRDETARLQPNLHIKDRERRQIERQHWRTRLLAWASITVATVATLALAWALIE
jgi:hypothetical protein